MAFWRKDEKDSQDTQDPSVFIARKEYAKAIQAYRSLIQAQPKNYVLNHKVAEVLCLAGREKESLADYSSAADGYSREGFLIKAVAILKKMQKLEPGNASIESRLASLSALASSTSSSGVRSSPLDSVATESAGGGAELSLDMEMMDDAASNPVAREEGPGTPAAPGLTITPLFSEFSPEELGEVLARLKHHSFPAGRTLVSEGDAGDSLFVLSEGRVKVVTTGPGSQPVDLAELKEGDFFGEVSLLTGKPRTATITSLEDTEVLELTREDLLSIEKRHPRVKDVIKDFYQRRVASTVDSMIKASKSSHPPRKS